MGERLAAKLGKKPGDTLEVSGRQLTISGILSTGGAEDDQIVAPLALAQQILGKPGAVRRVYVSALTKPQDALAVRDPKTMTPGGLRPLVLLALRAVDCLPVAGSHSAFARGADPPGRAKRRHRALAHQGTDAAGHASPRCSHPRSPFRLPWPRPSSSAASKSA